MKVWKIVVVCMVLSVALTALWLYTIPGLMLRLRTPKQTLSMGFYEEKEVWNRIRVDEKGRVVCAPIKQ
jgi:hypothetical protein